MIVTEEEAKTKRCHQTMIPVGTADIVWDAKPTRCIGSACMAWRWLDPVRLKTDADSKRGADDLGFCGKAGKP